MTSEFTQILADHEIALSGHAEQQCDRLCQLLLEKNAQVNLTALKTGREVELRHFADSIIQTGFLEFSGKSVIDIGTGAGFPGLPIKIAVPDTEITLLESLKKKADAADEFAKSLGLEGCRVVCGRAEEYVSQCREQFDLAISRAVAPLNLLAELCLPYVKPGGFFLALKGAAYEQELEQAQNAINSLGGKLARVECYTIDRVEFFTLVIEKVSPTPKIYPRKYAKMNKTPL